MDTADTNDLLSQLLATTDRIGEARSAGSSARDAARAMRSERRNARAAAEEAFGCREVR